MEDEVIEIVDWEILLSRFTILSKEERIFVNLRYGDKLPYKEIAELLHISEEAAKKRGQRILKKLRLLYEKGEKE